MASPPPAVTPGEIPYRQSLRSLLREGQIRTSGSYRPPAGPGHPVGMLSLRSIRAAFCRRGMPQRPRAVGISVSREGEDLFQGSF